MKSPQILLILLTGLFIGCSKDHSRLLEGQGSMISPSGNWEIELSESNPALTIRNVFEGWTNINSGAFVYVDQNDTVWAYDGGLEVLIFNIPKPKTYVMWDLFTWTNEVPDIVKQKLPNQPVKYTK